MRHPLYIIEQGATLTRSGRRLLVSKAKQTLMQAALIQVSQVVVMGNVQITTPALRLLLDENIPVVLLSQSGRFYGRLVGAESGNGALRVAQVVRSRDPVFALSTAQQMVRGKVHNIKVFLQRYGRRLDSPTVRDAAASVDRLLRRVPRTSAFCEQTPCSIAISSLMGVEGQATAIYFGVWKQLLQPPWQFHRRVRRPPTDPVNVLLSFGYTILAQNVLGAVLTVGLDPYVGFLHQVSYNRPSLALDLMEEFRPLIADSVALRCLNNRILTPEDFTPGTEEDRPIVLSQDGVKRFLRELETRLTQTFKDPRSGERTNYRRLMHDQARVLANTLSMPVSREGMGADKQMGVERADQLYQPFLAR